MQKLSETCRALQGGTMLSIAFSHSLFLTLRGPTGACSLGRDKEVWVRKCLHLGQEAQKCSSEVQPRLAQLQAPHPLWSVPRHFQSPPLITSSHDLIEFCLYPFVVIFALCYHCLWIHNHTHWLKKQGFVNMCNQKHIFSILIQFNYMCELGLGISFLNFVTFDIPICDLG